MKKRPPPSKRRDDLELSVAALVCVCAFGAVAVAIAADIALRFGFYTLWHSL